MSLIVWTVMLEFRSLIPTPCRLTWIYTICISVCVSAQNYRTALTAAIKEYQDLGLERRQIDDRLAQLAQTIGTLNRLLGLTATVPLGLTDAIRLVVRGSGVPMTPVDVRDRLGAMGFDLSKYANELAAVHTILKRLNESGELRFIPRATGKHQYAMNRPVVPVVLGGDIVQRTRDNTHEREAMRATANAKPSARNGRGRTTARKTRSVGEAGKRGR
jgi:hypothetical protein